MSRFLSLLIPICSSLSSALQLLVYAGQISTKYQGNISACLLVIEADIFFHSMHMQPTKAPKQSEIRSRGIAKMRCLADLHSHTTPSAKNLLRHSRGTQPRDVRQKGTCQAYKQPCPLLERWHKYRSAC